MLSSVVLTMGRWWLVVIAVLVSTPELKRLYHTIFIFIFLILFLVVVLFLSYCFLFVC